MLAPHAGVADLRRLTIASNDEKLVIVTNFVDHNIGIGCDDLLLGCQLGTLLEFEISDRSRQSEVSVHAAEVDKSARSCDPCLLAYITPQRVRSATRRSNLRDEGRGRRTFILRLVVE